VEGERDGRAGIDPHGGEEGGAAVQAPGGVDVLEGLALDARVALVDPGDDRVEADGREGWHPLAGAVGAVDARVGT
jgi:hypothetical protein